MLTCTRASPKRKSPNKQCCQHVVPLTSFSCRGESHTLFMSLLTTLLWFVVLATSDPSVYPEEIVGVGVSELDGYYDDESSAPSDNSVQSSWAHAAELGPDGDFWVFWTPSGSNYVTFEVQARTRGYVGFGFSPNGLMAGADLVVGWIKDGRVYFQDRHGVGESSPELDSSQDYQLLLAYENDTHTVFRFRRKYDTCDRRDYKITNDTVRLMYSLHSSDPESPSHLPYHGTHRRGAKSVFLVERVNQRPQLPSDVRVWEMRNPDVRLPDGEDTLYWCKIFKLPDIETKHHIIRYEPVFATGNHAYMHHVIVYECQGDHVAFDDLARHKGHRCYQANMPPLFFNCNNVIVAWAVGSEGLTLPQQVGYPLDPGSGPRYFMMETHYDNPNFHGGVKDSSGIRIYHTPTLRDHDAGVLSIGMDPNWKHIIPPGQPQVISEGHCISDCTTKALPSGGINILAVILHTHLIGRKMRLRQIRNGTEMPSIAEDNNYSFNYQEYRHLDQPVKVMPGDHLIGECVYNSEERTSITLGGLSTREEMCLAYAFYYPRVQLSLCYSLPSLPTVLRSLGIQELWQGSNPVKIRSPPELAEMTLEERLVTYDWEHQFNQFQDATRKGSFKPLCWLQGKSLLPGTENFEAYYPNITTPYKQPNTCQNPSPRRKKPRGRKRPGEETLHGNKVVNIGTDLQGNHLEEDGYAAAGTNLGIIGSVQQHSPQTNRDNFLHGVASKSVASYLLITLLLCFHILIPLPIHRWH